MNNIFKRMYGKNNNFYTLTVAVEHRCYWHQILSVLIQNTNNSTFFTCTLHRPIIGVLNSRRLKFDASNLNSYSTGAAEPNAQGAHLRTQYLEH